MAHTRARLSHESSKRRLVGYAFIHAAVDAHSRLAFAEVLDGERAVTAAGFWNRANQFFADHNISVETVLADNRSNPWKEALSPIKHRRTRPRRPQTNGKVCD